MFFQTRDSYFKSFYTAYKTRIRAHDLQALILVLPSSPDSCFKNSMILKQTGEKIIVLLSVADNIIPIPSLSQLFQILKFPTENKAIF